MSDHFVDFQPPSSSLPSTPAPSASAFAPPRPRHAFPCDPVRLGRLRALVREHQTSISRCLLRLGVPASDVDDATQEVLVVAARRLDAVRVDCERAFLLGTASRVASTSRRTRRRRREQPTAPLDDFAWPGRDPEQHCDHAFDRSLLMSALGGLAESERTVLVLCELEELPLRDVAERLGIPLGTVSSRLRRARAELRAAGARLEAQARFRARKARARGGAAEPRG